MSTRVSRMLAVNKKLEEKQSAEKKELNTRAQKIVEEMLENNLPADIFLERLPYINQYHYEDITEERAIEKKCGYPLCPKMLPDNRCSQKYKLSIITNTVYDVTNRKNFCSNYCYGSSVYVKDQLSTSPLSALEHEIVPSFKLMPSNSKGAIGEVVDIAITEKIPKKDPFISLYDFTEASLNEMEPEHSAEEPQKSTDEVQIPEEKEESVIKEVKENKPHCSNNAEKNENVESKKVDDKSSEIKLKDSLIGDVFERTVPKVDPLLIAGHKHKLETSKEIRKSNSKMNTMSLKSDYTSIILDVEKAFGEWIGFDTLLFIFGEMKMKELVSDKSDNVKEYLTKVVNENSCTLQSYNKYQDLCRKLNLMELEDQKYDQELVGNKASKPLPSYSMIQEDGEMLNLKVKAFYRGEMTIPVVKNDETSKEDQEMPNLPLLEKSNQLVLRRKIFLKGLDKVLPDMLKALKIPPREISGDVQQLIGTYKLEPHNVMFKTMQWNLIAIVIVKLLSLKNQRLSEQVMSDHLQLLLMSYKLDFGYLDRLIWWLTDIDRIITQ